MNPRQSLKLVTSCAAALLATACAKREEQTAQPVPEAHEATAAPVVQAPPPPPSLAARIPSDVREQADALFASFTKQLDAHPPKHKVAFEVPAMMCCDNGDHPCLERCLHQSVLFYSDVDHHGWGLGPMYISDDGLFWVADEAVPRAVAFDRQGKLAEAVDYSEQRVSPVEGLEVTADEVRVWQPLDGGHPKRIVRYTRQGKWIGNYSYPTGRNGSITLEGSEPRANDAGIVVDSSTERGVFRDKRTDRVEGYMEILPRTLPTTFMGHHYAVDCGVEGDPNAKATFEIDGHAVPAPECVGLLFVGSAGDFIAGGSSGFWHFDVNGKPLGVTREPASTDTIQIAGGIGTQTSIGPDGKIYAMVARKKSVQMLELVFTAPPPSQPPP